MLHYNAQIQNAEIRRTQFEGREHIVAPVILMVEGVHNGSGGPLYYPASELQASAHLWNGRPLPIQHPEQQGQPISCNSPEVVQAQSVGWLWNVVFEPHPVPRLKGEIWVDVNKVQQISPPTLEALTRNLPLEVSTGLFSDDEMVSGIWGNESYNGVVRNIRPDHLALLPGAIGACSWQDGCGVRANKEGGTDLKINEEEQGVFKKLLGKVNSFVQHLLGNEMGMDEKMQKVRRAVYQMDGPMMDNYVQEVYDNYVVYECRPGPQSSPGSSTKLYKREYTVSESGEIELGNEIMEVKREVNYVPVANTEAIHIQENKQEITNNEKKEEQEMVTEERKQKVNALITNGAFVEADRTLLENMDCPQFSRIEALAGRPVTNAADRTESKVQTFDELLANASPEAKASWALLQKQIKDNRDGLIARIKGNAQNKITDEVLNSLGDDALQGIADSLAPVANYAGAGGAQTSVIANKVEPMALPDHNVQK
jgi:hypothetical protein